MKDFSYTSDHLLNIAAFCPQTHALGPGRRAVIWVQGCALNCPGCLAPEWIPHRPARLISPATLAQEINTLPALDGLTLSGGEPMLQAAALAQTLRLVRQEHPLNVICFTGYRLETLRSNPPGPGVAQLLEQLDLLVDGPYIAGLNDGLGLRGSANQRFHHLSSRLTGYDFTLQPRRVEVYLQAGELSLVGIPPSGVLPVLQDSLEAEVEVWQ